MAYRDSVLTRLLKHSLGGSPNATAIIGFELYLADSAVWGPEPLQRLALAIAHWRAQGIRPLLFLLVGGEEMGT